MIPANIHMKWMLIRTKIPVMMATEKLNTDCKFSIKLYKVKHLTYMLIKAKPKYFILT